MKMVKGVALGVQDGGCVAVDDRLKVGGSLKMVEGRRQVEGRWVVFRSFLVDCKYVLKERV
jgi:hypothetical protein